MISAGEDEVPNETFVPIYNEISAELFWFFMVLHELSGRHAFEVTPYRLSKHETTHTIPMIL